MPSFGETSVARLSFACGELQTICYDVIKHEDFSVIETYRNKKTQDEYYHKGVTTLEWPNSKHNTKPSEAIDIWPYVPEFGALNGSKDQILDISLKTGKTVREVEAYIKMAFARLAGCMFASAYKHDIRIRWGGDWDGDRSGLDQSFNDLPHFEIVR